VPLFGTRRSDHSPAVSTALRHRLIGTVQFVPTVERIHYGAGALAEHLRLEVEGLKAKRVILLAPRSLRDQSPFRRVSAILGERLAETFVAAFEHVPLEAAVETAAAARPCDADLVVALGGGSVIDAAKALRACRAAELTSPEQFGTFMRRGGPLAATLIPQISIATTLSGSEYTRSFSVTDFKAGVKRSFTASAVASRVIIYDPTVALNTPMTLWLSSGVMAIGHAVEVLCASPAHLVGDALKTLGLRLLITHLPHTGQASNDLEARLRCQVGAWLVDHSPLRTHSAGPATPALPSHALAYELAAVCRLSYGLSACVTLPPCMRWTAARDRRVVARQAESPARWR